MGLFARRMEEETTADAQRGGGPGADPTVPARFVVLSVAPAASTGDAVMTGLVLSSGPARVGQLVVHLPEGRWPAPGRELPAVMDAEEPESFAVTWAVTAVVAGAQRTVTASQWNDPELAWDPGPDDAHERSLAKALLGDGADGRGPVSTDLATTLQPDLVARLADRGWTPAP